MKYFLTSLLILSICTGGSAQDLLYTEADTLRGSVTPERAWWDVYYYDLEVGVIPSKEYIEGSVSVYFETIDPGKTLQFDLRQPLEVDSVMYRGQILPFYRTKHVFFVELPDELNEGSRDQLSIYYSGTPRRAPNPPWDGGVTWSSDEEGSPWIATSCQGLGASVWWPNKDHLSDEPDSMRISIAVPNGLIGVSNGKLEETESIPDGRKRYAWFVSNPINNYNVSLNIGNYIVIRDTFNGQNGKLPLSYWVLKAHEEQARQHFGEEVEPMLRCFEEWFGPYPFYEDGYALVETPYLGMEHQSAIAYGNHFNDGYRGMDVSGSGWGRNWDYIVVHESGHEWWGNNVSVSDIADLWVHEGFTAYSEGIYVECLHGKEAGAEYLRGTRRRIRNDRPIIGPYGVNQEGSGDMYFKAANMLHMIRRMVGYDSLWREILLGLQDTFSQRTINSRAVEDYMDSRVPLDLDPVFDQYLRQVELPELEYRFIDNGLMLRWRAATETFRMPVELRINSGEYRRFTPTKNWLVLPWKESVQTLEVHPDYYIKAERANN